MKHLIYLLFLTLIFWQMGCERNPEQGQITVQLSPQFTSQEGVSVQALPSTFVCYAVFVEFESDEDDSHCLNSGTSDLVPVTSAFGPFQADEAATFTISTADTGAIGFPMNVTVHLLATQTQANCDAAESQNDLREMLGTNLASASNTTFAIESGANNLSFTIGSMLADSFSNCQGVNNVSEL